MLIHSVFFWLKPEVSEEDIQTFRLELKKLIRVDLVEKGFLSQPGKTPDRAIVDHSFHSSITLFFNSVEDHVAYQDHPTHHVFEKSCSAMWEKAIVYDSETFDTSG